MRTAISFIFAFAMAALPATALPAATQDTLPLNPSVDVIQSRSLPLSVDGASPVVGRMTNAKRLSTGVPPLTPKSRHRAATAPRSDTPMPPPIPHGCNILVKGVDGASHGYITPVWNGFGVYGTLQSDQAGSLEVTFNVSPDDPSPEEVEIHAENVPNTKYPFFGATFGYGKTRSNLGTGGFNYALITGTTQIPAGSIPTTGDNNSFTGSGVVKSNAEAAIWKYDPVTHEITAQWINRDRSRPKNYLVWFKRENALVLTGDIGSFQRVFGISNPAVTLTCVPPQT